MINFVDVRSSLLISNGLILLVDEFDQDKNVAFTHSLDLLNKNVEIINAASPQFLKDHKLAVIESRLEMGVTMFPLGRYITCIFGSKTETLFSMYFINFLLEYKIIESICKELEFSQNTTKRIEEIKYNWSEYYKEELDNVSLYLVK